jgi:hypothetical protein
MASDVKNDEWVLHDMEKSVVAWGIGGTEENNKSITQAMKSSGRGLTPGSTR